MRITVLAALVFSWLLSGSISLSFAAHCVIDSEGRCDLEASRHFNTNVLLAGWMDLEGEIIVESIRSQSQGLIGFEINSVGSYLEVTNGVATPPFSLQLMNSESQITFANLGTSPPIDDWNSGVFYDLPLSLDESTNPCVDLTLFGGSRERSAFCTIEGDTNFDGLVNFQDFLNLSANYGQSNAVWPQGDFDWDRQVGFSDFLSLKANFGQSIPELAADAQATTSVPEPSGLTLLTLLLGVVTFAFARRQAR